MKALCYLVLLLNSCHSLLIERLFLMLSELVLAVVRIEEHGYEIGWIKVSFLVVLTQLRPSNIEGCHEVLGARLTSSCFKVR